MAKRKIIWSLKAKRDLFLILDFYFKRNGTKTFSVKLNTRFNKIIKVLIKHPEIGIKTELENVRVLIEGDFNIFYKIEPKIIEIITIWDNRQDLERLSFGE